MEFGLGVKSLGPDAFWRMTLREYDAALAGHNRFHGGGEPEVDVEATRAWLDEMKQIYPDNPARKTLARVALHRSCEGLMLGCLHRRL